MNYNRRYLVYDDQTSGHHAAYINYLSYKIEYREAEYVFAIRKELVKNLNISQKKNVRILALEEGEKKSYFQSYLEISRIIKENDITNVVFIVIMRFLLITPFLSLVHKIGFSGILYKIHMYESGRGILTRAIDKFKYLLLVKNKFIEYIFVLNDFRASNHLNKVFNTTKFKFIPDPVDSSKKQIQERNLLIPKNLLSTIISNKKHNILHIGSLNKNKGTLFVLDLILELSKNNKSIEKYNFIIAGRVHNDIRDDFYDKVSRINYENMYIIDRYLNDDEFHYLFQIANKVLCPYHRTSQSSGILGYTALYNVACIVPNKGVISRLVQKYDLGLCMDNISVNECHRLIDTEKKVNGNDYINDNSIKNFANIILG